MHPKYKQGPGLNADIALLQLSSPAKLNDRVVKACMPRQGVPPKAGTNCYIAGKCVFHFTALINLSSYKLQHKQFFLIRIFDLTKQV